jgi:GTP cyclohydrolase II
VLNRMPAILRTDDTRTLRQIERAVTELRRGGFVVLRDVAAAFVAQAAETVNSDSLARLRALSGGALSLVLTRRRAAALGLAEPPRGPGGAVLLRVADDAVARDLRDLADPSAVATEPLALASATAALGTADAAVELVKLARLLPAAVVGELPPRISPPIRWSPRARCVR